MATGSRPAGEPSCLRLRALCNRSCETLSLTCCPGTRLAQHDWLPPLADAADAVGPATFDAVVHFVQAGSGTGVHVGDGLVLTCAHVVDARDDDGEDEGAKVTRRIGRRKVLMFASGRTFIAECAAAAETTDGAQVSMEMALSPLPQTQ